MISNAYKWGLHPKQVQALTVREYSIMELAQFEKRAEEREIVRSIRHDIINFAGMGASKKYSPEEIQPIPLIDNMDLVMPIRTMADALKLLKTFEAHSG